MMSVPLVLVFLIYATILWNPCNPYYIFDFQGKLRGKLIWLSHELVIDAEMKIKAVQYYRDQYYKSLQYQLGEFVYEIRDFYKKMVLIYTRSEKNLTYQIDTNRRPDLHTELIRDFVILHRMGMEIENKVNMMQMWQRKRESKESHHKRMQAVADALRSGTNQEYDELEDVPLREVQVRQRMARSAAAGAPPPRAPAARARPRESVLELGDRRKNKKWQHVRDDDFTPY